jgi:hypothetical protein
MFCRFSRRKARRWRAYALVKVCDECESADYVGKSVSALLGPRERPEEVRQAAKGGKMSQLTVEFFHDVL